MSSFLTRVALLLFASGFCSLVYQMAWLRLLRLVFGASTAASAAVLAIFMGGLGLGSLLLGPRADRSRNPLGLYARLEIGIALAAAASPLLILAVRRAYIGLGGTESLGTVGGTLVRLALAAVVLGLPTFLMGGTLPATVRAVTRSTDAGRRTVGLLYAVNTLGAVTGTVVTVFWALELEGIRKTVWLAALVNLLVAMTARAMARRWQQRRDAEGGPAPATEPVPAEGVEPTAPRAAPLGFVLGAAAAVGFAFFLMELVWYRMLAPILGGTSYTFGMILAVALAGIGAGGLVYSAGGRARRPTLVGFGATCALEAFFLILPFALGDRLAVLAMGIQGLDAGGFGGLVLEWGLVTVLVVFPAALVAGYQFPLLVGVLGAGRRAVGREVGLTYAWNTLGAIAGAVAGGFGLLPLVTAPGIWRSTAIGLAGLALAAAVLAAVTGRRVAVSAAAGVRSGRTVTPIGVAVVVVLSGTSLVLSAAEGPTAYWRHGGIGGRRAQETFSGPNDLRAAIRLTRGRLVWQEDGRESSIGLLQGAGYTFVVNGKADGSALGDAPTQVLGGLVGAMLHPDPRRSLVIGLGTGSTAGWLAAVPGMERVDVVELEPAVVRVAEDCAPVNRDVLDRDNVHLILGDGRELLLTTRQRYDVIFSEPSNPYRAGISSLFTQEFYRAAAERLTENGLFLQWLQGYEVDPAVIRTAYATLGSVFPAVESWQTLHGDLLLVAGPKPVVHDWRRVARRAAQDPYREALERVWGVSGAAGFYSAFVAGPELARAISEGAARLGEPLNTDDHPVIEYGFVRNLGRKGLFKVEDLGELAHRLGAARPHFASSRGPGAPSSTGATGGRPDWAAVRDAESARGVFLQYSPPPPPDAGPGLEARSRARDLYRQEDLSGALQAWESQGDPPRHPADLLLVADSLASAADPRAPLAADRLSAALPTEAAAVRALYASRRDDWSEAADHLVAFFDR
ncbi:MAG: fused MFS/spermidine synthase, partial [Gemmatimonadota bacterium]